MSHTKGNEYAMTDWCLTPGEQRRFDALEGTVDAGRTVEMGTHSALDHDHMGYREPAPHTCWCIPQES